MGKKVEIVWNLRRLMATRDMFQTTDLVGPLAERGVHLSREQVFLPRSVLPRSRRRAMVGTRSRPRRIDVDLLCGASPAAQSVIFTTTSPYARKGRIADFYVFTMPDDAGVPELDQG
ncbi:MULTISPECIES: hypothetical protein [unclassified Micromonospora]|uniref:hypothetical protein n=1 Tax=unclassified Micromonospora TaxID=2617518 RepID=UPI002FF0C04C